MHAQPDALPTGVAVASLQEGADLFDQAAREALGISGKDFLQRWDRGEFADSEDPAVDRVAIMMPFAR